MRPQFFAWMRAIVPGLLLSACASDLTPASEVIEPRLYGARIEVAGDTNRARIALGETFVLRQFFALPRAFEQAPEPFDMKLTGCLGTRAAGGVIVCALSFESEEFPVLPLSIAAVSDVELRTSPIPLPSRESLVSGLPGLGEFDADKLLEAFDQVILFGGVCAGGKVERIAGKKLAADGPSELFRCTDNQQAAFPDVMSFTMTLGLDLGRLDDENQNPNFACDASAEEGGACREGVSHKGEAPRIAGPVAFVYPAEKKGADRLAVSWTSYPGAKLPTQNCKDDKDLLQVEAGSGEHLIRMRFDARDREHYQAEREEFGKLVIRDLRETLEVTHAIQEYGGELERHLSVVQAEVEDAEAEIEVIYEPPKQSKEKEAEIPAGGRVVRFFFSLRDQRGGFDFTTRELCLLPPK